MNSSFHSLPTARDPFEERLAEAWPLDHWQGIIVAVAVSGGADSVALLHAVAKLANAEQASSATEIVAVHFDHRLRDESKRDAEFVVALAARLGLRCVVGVAREGELATPSEANARQARYRFFEDATAEIGARLLVTAHTQDDQIETILHRILRGTGLAGLSGIPALRPLSIGTTLVRPMLGVSRREVESYLDRLGQDYRQDASNADVGYTRNRIRAELLPALRESFNAQVDLALLRLSNQAREAEVELAAQTRRTLDRGVSQKEGAVLLHRATFAELSSYAAALAIRTIWAELGWSLQAMTQTHWVRLAEMATSGGATASRVDFPGGIQAEGVPLGLRLTPGSSFKPTKRTDEPNLLADDNGDPLG